MKDMTYEEFKELLGREAENDDLARVNCKKAGEMGHWSCGWCFKHNNPMFECSCVLKKKAK